MATRRLFSIQMNHSGLLRLAFGVGALCLVTVKLFAQVAVQDGFESGVFDSGWDRVDAGVGIDVGMGAEGTTNCARLPGTANLGARLDGVAANGARSFYIDCYIRIQDSSSRTFNLHVSTSTGAVGSGAPAINLKYDTAAGWAVYNGAWQSLTGLPAITHGAWYRLRVSGEDWGLPSARYSVRLSDAGGNVFASSVSNLTWYQAGSPSTNPARYFDFTSDFGSNPGFDVDQVDVEVTVAVPATPTPAPDAVINISGVYPHLSVFSSAGEIGIGAVAPWADRLWFVTYPPHVTGFSSDKLWMVDSNLNLSSFPGSTGGTCANRMIHRETQQLNIGRYLVDTNGNVRTISYLSAPGRLTGSARHLADPTNKIYIATMEEGLYEVTVTGTNNPVPVTTLRTDQQNQSSAAGLLIPGYHGKGLYSGQGKLFYSNNGETSWSIGSNFAGFEVPGGVLTENDGSDFVNGWTTVERKNTTEITGPGGIFGNTSVNDPVWTLSWDKRSVLLKLLDNGAWHNFRLPKGSYTQDSFEGWYTEWPRIREITNNALLMHMHGLFYHFPKTFSSANTAGISPICTMVKMPVDYCWWNGRLVMGRDDASTTGQGAPVWTGQSDSALWFGQVSDMEQWGPPAGFGGPWKNDAVKGGVPGEPFLVNGFLERVLHLKQAGGSDLNLALQYDPTGSGAWLTETNLTIPANGYTWCPLPPSLDAIWVRLVPEQDATNVTAYFHLNNPPREPDPGLFAGIANGATTNAVSDGILRSRDGDARTLQFAATLVASNGAVSTAYYEIDGSMQLRRATNATQESLLRTSYSLAESDFSVDAASVIYTEGANRFRLPKRAAGYETPYASGWPRGLREVVTERDFFDASGTLYEIPKSGSGGFRRLRPITTHDRHISDFALWRGLLVVAGLDAGATNNGHVFRSDDGQAALWFGDVDDLWRMGPPRGVGGPWNNTPVTNGVPSDPYLMFGYEHKELKLTHDNPGTVNVTVQVDFAADNTWSDYAHFTVPPGQTFRYVFPPGFSAHWVRLVPDTTTVATATFVYGPSIVPPLITNISAGDGQVSIQFEAGPSDTAEDFGVLAAADVDGPYTNANAAITGSSGSFETVLGIDGRVGFFRILRF